MAFDPKLYQDNKSGIGMPADEKATDTTSSWTVVSLLKGILSAFTTGIVVTGSATAANQTTELARIGDLTETAPATDTASSGLNGRLQRIAQRVTSLIAQLPASLGVKARTASISVAMATEDAALFPASLGAKTAANSLAVTLATDDAAVATLGATGDAAASAGGTGSISAKLRLATTQLASLVTGTVLAAGSALIGRAVADASAATGGVASTSRIVSAANTTNATSAKASAGRLYGLKGYNAAASVRYIKFYNKASAPTVGTDTPVMTIAVSPTSLFNFIWPHGYSFSTGIAYALTTGSADSDTGALTAADIVGLNVDYT